MSPIFLIGVKGIVRNEQGTALAGAEVKIVGREVSFRTTEEGEYWRLLLPGSYELQVNTTHTRMYLNLKVVHSHCIT